MKKYQLISIVLILLTGLFPFTAKACIFVDRNTEPAKKYKIIPPAEIVIKATPDFEITGDGSAANWEAAQWIYLQSQAVKGDPLTTRVKILYSKTGIYFLFQCRDELLTATMESDFLDLWKEDVVEVFLWPDESIPAYFEYEISPLDYELPILISNENGDLVRWMPFHYDADRKTRHATYIEGGEKKNLAAITAWRAEFFIPYKLMRPLNNIQPGSGTRWRANLYRVDYDHGKRSGWSWQTVEKSYHDIVKYGSLIFE